MIRRTIAPRRAVSPAVAALFVVLAHSAVAARAASPAPVAGPVVVDDLFRLGFVGELAVSPDGASAVYAWSAPDRDLDGYTSRLFRLDLAAPGRAARALTGDDVDASTARFSPDGRLLAWLESSEDGVELRWATYGTSGLGRARTALGPEDGISDFAWSPDGARFVVVRDDPGPVPDENDPYVVTRSVARGDGVGFTTGPRAHLWTVDRASGAKSARRLTEGPFDDGDPAWSPDGRWIAFVSNRNEDPDATDDTDLYRVSPDGGAPILLYDGAGPDSAPAWSHRGDRVAFLSIRRANDYYQPQRLMTVTIDGEGSTAPADLTGALDAWVAADAMAAGAPAAPPAWSDDDRTFTLPFERHGATFVAEVDSATGAMRELEGGRFVHGLVRELPGGRGTIFSRTDPTHPPELWLRPRDGEARRLTRFYDDWLASRRLVSPEKVVARNGAGDDVEAWLYPPANLDAADSAGTKHPLVVYIHGGPQGFDGDFFDFDLENQLFPAAGWAVLRVNYRGSTSYGEAFSRAIWGDWHSREYEDLMASLDHAIATHPWIDANRLGIGGWSYGGIMTLWTVGHTDRFRVGVPERLSFDYLSSFGEDQWYVWMLSELGSPLDHADLYRRLSPGTYVANVKTPLYLIANEDDFNCPLPQTLQLYQRLRLLGQRPELVVYPGESHSMSSLAHLADRLRRLLGWFGRHLDD